jgi:hypothetical protein
MTYCNLQGRTDQVNTKSLAACSEMKGKCTTALCLMPYALCLLTYDL